MKLKFFFRLGIVCGFILSTFSISGQEFSGTLGDAATGEPIPYANIQLDDSYGAITNEEGKFSFLVPAHQIVDSIRFSSLGYTTKAIAVADFKKGETVQLSRQLVQLDALFLGKDQPDARQVMDSVRANLEKNHHFTGVQMKVFNQSENAITPYQVDSKIRRTKNLLEKDLVKRFNKVVDSISETSIGHTSVNYTSILGNAALHKGLKMNLEKATYLLNQEKNIDLNDFTLQIIERLIDGMNSKNTYHVRSGLFKIGDSLDLSERLPDMKDAGADTVETELVKQTFSNLIKQVRFDGDKEDEGFSSYLTNLGSVPDEFIKKQKDYNYEIRRATAINDEYIYEIKFWPDRNLFGRKGKFEGVLYVSMEDYGILRLEYNLVDGAYGKKVSLGIFGIQFRETEKSGLLIYQRKDDDYLPKYLRFSGMSHIHLNRSLVMTENNPDRKERVQLKTKFLLDFENRYQNEWLMSKEEQISEQEYADFIENKGVHEQKLNSYNSKIWENENTLMPTEAILKFKGGN